MSRFPKIRGTWWVVITHVDGSVEITPRKSNEIVLDASRLFAALMKNDTTHTEGIMYHAVGSGDPAWDTGGIPAPSVVSTTLLDEVGRKVPDQIVYLDGSGIPTLTVTNKIQVKTTYGLTDLAPGGVYLREHGLVGGSATSSPDTGLLIDLIHMERKYKNSTITYAFFIELEF